MNEDFSSLGTSIRAAESQHVSLVQSFVQSTGTIITLEVSVPLSVAVIQVANKADLFLATSTVSEELKLESDFIVENSVDALSDALLHVIDLCASEYLSEIATKEWVLEILVILGAALTIACYVLIVPIILKVVRQKREALGAFAFVPTAEIEKIIAVSQRVSIRDAKYNSRLSEFKDEDDDILGYNKKSSPNTKLQTVHSKQVTQTQPPQMTQDPMLPTHEMAAQEDKDECSNGDGTNLNKPGALSVEAENRERTHRKREHLRSGE